MTDSRIEDWIRELVNDQFQKEINTRIRLGTSLKF